MKQTGKCPKCGGTEILLVPGNAVSGESGIGIGESTVPTDWYICCRCGYCEQWIPLPYMGKLRRHFDPPF